MHTFIFIGRDLKCMSVQMYVRWRPTNNKNRMTVARATALYCILVCVRRKESAAVSFMTQQHIQTKTDTAAQSKQQHSRSHNS